MSHALSTKLLIRQKFGDLRTAVCMDKKLNEAESKAYVAYSTTQTVTLYNYTVILV